MKNMWQIGGETWTRTGGGKSYIEEAQAMMEAAATAIRNKRKKGKTRKDEGGDESDSKIRPATGRKSAVPQCFQPARFSFLNWLEFCLVEKRIAPMAGRRSGHFEVVSGHFEVVRRQAATAARARPCSPSETPFTSILGLIWSHPASPAVLHLPTLTPVSDRVCLCRLRSVWLHRPRPPPTCS